MSYLALRANLFAALHLVLDLLPGFVVSSTLYLRFRRAVSVHPRRFTPTAASAGPGQWRGRKMATKGTALVVEGFPGSGNSFVSNGLRKNIGADVEIESHFHYTAQLKRALAFGVPTIVIVREPQAAGTSLKSKQPELWNWLIVLRWILYHRYVLAHARELHVVLFSEAIRDLDVVRARCPALQTLAHGPLLADPELRRPSERKIPLAEGGRASRALRSVARDLYARIETITRTTDAGPDGPPPARDRRP